MTAKPFLRDVALLTVAAAIGWWAHGARGASLQAVEAQRSSASSARGSEAPQNLAFQLGGGGFEGSLTIYSPNDHTLYVYPAVLNGSSHVNCAYMMHVARPGAAVERENCAVGSLF